MYTLFISTYDKYINIGLLKDNEIIDSEIKESEQSHSIYTVPLIKKILENNNLTVKDLNQIEVINGPGSFTGVRIGVTIAKTLAYTLNIPIKTISTLEAYAVSLEKQDDIIVTLRDLKGVYYGIFNKNNELLKPLNYLNKNDFDNYISTNNLTNNLINEEPILDIKKIHEYLKNKQSTNSHQVNPLYIKQIEVEKC